MKFFFAKPAAMGAAVLLLSALSQSSASAATYDAVAGFSSSNPSGSWTYGAGTLGTSNFTAFDHYTSNCTTAGFACWQPPVTSLNVPLVGLNQTSSTINSGTVVIPTGVLDIHPGQSTDVIVQWTAPAAGTYDIEGFFELLDVSPSGVIGSVYNGSNLLYTGTLTGPGAVHPGTIGGKETFSLNATLSAGDVISFGVNNDGNYLFDSTGFDATITPRIATPEPGSIGLVAAAALAIFEAKRRLRK